MPRIIWNASARCDIASMDRYISEHADVSTANAFLEKLRDRCERLASLPGTDRSALIPGLRSTPHQNYVIYFRDTGDALEIVNVLDARGDVAALFNHEDGDD